jgi:hypothetical protein
MPAFATQGPRRGANPVLFLAAIMLLGAGWGVPDAVAHGHGKDPGKGHGAFCSATAQAAATACRHEKLDDYWIAVGNCDNTADREERRSCLMDAAETLGEAQDECRDQFDARRDACDQLGEAPYVPEIDPADFVDPAAIGGAVAPNPYMPLVPGTVWTYESGDEVNTVEVTDEVKEILGVPCAVVHDVVETDGEVTEDTRDFMCQDVEGDVWYFGETSQTLEDGEVVDLEGSWLAGVDDAQPGILMYAHPEVGDVYRQEYSLGDAEDLAEVTSTAADETVPAAACGGHCVVTREFSSLEPGVEADKYYAPGVGLILEVEDGARNELVGLTTP